MIIEAKTSVSPQTRLPALLNPNNTRPNPSVERVTLTISNFAFDPSDTFTKYLKANI